MRMGGRIESNGRGSGGDEEEGIGKKCTKPAAPSCRAGEFCVRVKEDVLNTIPYLSMS